ncbi:MAG: hypothetical protein AVO35_12860 [Candidatus Aegiribacteria sp. MLS_C]|nr:MAG: hypothetical protein AVO35_12860 [Candidatus Aegiribacteria sp. MLS_C]
MKYVLLTLFLVSSVIVAAGFGSASSWQSFGGAEGEAPEMVLLESDQNHMLLEVSIPGFWLSERAADGSIWDVAALPGCYPQGEVGLPSLPSVSGMFALPFGTEAVITVEEVTSTTYGDIRIMPLQTPEIDMEHDPFPFVISEDFYASDRIFPGSWVTVDNQGAWSGLNVSRLLINPFSFDPASGTLEVASSMIVRVDFQGQVTSIADPVTPSLIPAMERNVMNWDVFEAAASPVEGSRDDGVEYVFVCTESSDDWVLPLVEMHHYLGLHSRIETLSTPATTGDIKTAITDNYTTGVTRFACIVGTHNELPSYSWSGYTGDYWYGCIDGAPDVYAEMGIGRLTGDQTQIEHQVEKIIDGYANFAFDDRLTTEVTPSEAILAAHEEQYPGKYTQCMNELAAYSYSLIDFTFTKVYPPEGGTAAMVSDGMNNDMGTVTYRGHGDVTYWAWSPGWNASNINALTNNFKPPVFNIACLCGDYTGSGTCLAEAWQWATNGSSGNLAATDPSYTYPNHDYIKEIYKEIFDYANYRITEATNAASVTTIGIHGSIGEANAKMYVWFGDPASDIWTFDQVGEPGELYLDHPTNIYPGTQDITVTVTDDGVPVEGALVTITDGVDGYGSGMTCYEEGTTNASGQATINVTIPASGEIHIGAFKHDYRYAIVNILIGTGTAGAETPVPVLSLGRVSPNPVAENASLGFSVPSSGRVDISVYDVSGRIVENIFDDAVEAGSHSLTWAPGENISNGVYFIRLTTEGGTLTRQAMIIR